MIKLYYLLGISILIGFSSCKSKSQSTPVLEQEQSTVLIDLEEGASEIKLLLDLKEFNLVKIKQISRPLNIILCSYDESKIELDTLLDTLKNLDYVENAQSNKKTTNRN